MKYLIAMAIFVPSVCFSEIYHEYIDEGHISVFNYSGVEVDLYTDNSLLKLGSSKGARIKCYSGGYRYISIENTFNDVRSDFQAECGLKISIY